MTVATVEWILLCERAEIVDDKMNLYGVHTAVISDRFPLVLENLPFVICATGEPDEAFSFSIQVFGEGQVAQTAEYVVQLNDGGIALRKFTIDRIVLPKPGRYSLILRGQDQNLLAHSLYFAKEK